MIRNISRSLLASTFLGISAVALMPMQKAFACGQDTILGVRAWHYYLPCEGDQIAEINSLNQVWLIGLAIFDSILVIAGLAAVVFIVWGGVKYITSQGKPEETATARKTIVTAIAGLAITVSSTFFVRFVVDFVGATPGDGDWGIPGGPGDGGTSLVANAFTYLYAIVGLVTVIFVIIGSIKFATSTGDPQKAASARNTILYAIVGLVITISAATITSYVLEQLG